jgi:hypothetical protein
MQQMLVTAFPSCERLQDGAKHLKNIINRKVGEYKNE